MDHWLHGPQGRGYGATVEFFESRAKQ